MVLNAPECLALVYTALDIECLRYFSFKSVVMVTTINNFYIV